MRIRDRYALRKYGPHIIICDRCRTEFQDYEHFFILNGESSEGYGHEKYELCPKCEREFIEWIEAPYKAMLEKWDKEKIK